MSHPSERTPTVEIPDDLRDVVTTTFTSSCAWGCTVRTVDGQEQPHICVGEQVIAAVAPELAFARVQHIAGRLKPLLRELLGDSWVDGVRSGRRGPCYGVDPVVPEGHADDVGCWCGVELAPDGTIMHTTRTAEATWIATSLGVLTATRPIGRRVRLTVDHLGQIGGRPATGQTFEGELAALNRSDLSLDYYAITIRDDHGIELTLDLPLNHPVDIAEATS